mgnify:CR=1 FL=1
MGAAGYENGSTFVRSAVLTKCQDIASGIADLYKTRVTDNKRRTYSPVSYSKLLKNYQSIKYT